MSRAADQQRHEEDARPAQFHRATGLPVHAIRRLAEADAFASLSLARRQAVWQTLELKDDDPGLFEEGTQARRHGGTKGKNDETGKFAIPFVPACLRASVPPLLPPMPLGQEVMTDYATTTLSLKQHPLALIREHLNSLRILPGAFGTTSVSLSLGFHPETMRPTFPAFASYLDKYLGPARYRLTLTDPSGSQLLEAVGRDRMMTVRYRLQRGRLVSLLGNPHPWPDTLRLNADVSLKVKLFRVGFSKLATDFVIGNSGHDRSWTITARHEPDWDLPLITERLIRSPLRRPFEGAGSMFRVSVRDSAGMQTLFTRAGRLEVQESTIMRFIGSLGSHMLGDLDKRVEAEEDRFIRDGFRALQADLHVVGGRWRAETENGAQR